jgi:hypothetical protein
MSIESWLNRTAARARLHELAGRIEGLQQERMVLTAAISFARGEAVDLSRVATGAPASDSGKVRRGWPPVTNGAAPRGGRGESMTLLLANAIKAGPAGKGWTIGELVAALEKTHPERVRASNASSLISAALAQALRAKRPLFVSRKRRGKRSHLYRLAKPNQESGGL